MALRNATRGTVLADRERWAVTAADRARGLLDTDGLSSGEALVISPCNSVHMFGMRYALDVVFVDRSGRVVRAIENLCPMRFTRLHFRAHRAIELPVGVISATGTQRGDTIDLGEPPEHAGSSPLILWAIVVTAALVVVTLLTKAAISAG